MNLWFAFFPALFPLYLLRGTFLGIPATLPEVLLGFSFLLFVAQGLRSGAWRQWFVWGDPWRIWPVGLFLGAAFLTLLVRHDLTALGILKGWILFPLLYFWILRQVFYQKPSLVPFALRSLLFGGTVLAGIALFQEWQGTVLTPDGRASGPFESANYLALYLGPLVVYALFAFFESEDKQDKLFLALAGVLCAAALFLTESYASFIAVGFACALGAYLKRDLWWAKRFWLGGAAIVLFSGLLASQWGSPKLEQFLDFEGRSSSSVRIEVYQTSLHLLKLHPFGGIGLGHYAEAYTEAAPVVLGKSPMEWVMIHPHNIVLAFWLNMGFLGLFAFVWLCVRALAWLFEPQAKERRLAALMLVCILVHGMFDTPYFKNDLAFQFWFLMAILL